MPRGGRGKYKLVKMMPGMQRGKAKLHKKNPMIEMNPSTEEQAKQMPGMQRGQAKLLMMPMEMLEMAKLNPCREEQEKLT